MNGKARPIKISLLMYVRQAYVNNILPYSLHVIDSRRSMRNYKTAIRSLNNLQTNFSVIENIHKQHAAGKPRNGDLIPEMLDWLRRVGLDPADLDVLNPIHITGTKGKGSTCAFVQSILLQYPLKVGLYTSPHLTSVRERIMIQGQPLEEGKFAEYFFDVFDRLENSASDETRFPTHIKGAKPMYFRYLTLMSFYTMLKEKVDSAIYEVGIGGEYDSTNMFLHPAACGITSLGIDHVMVLGNTVEEIAWNKAGIFKKGSPAYTLADQPPKALDVLRQRAEEKGVSKFQAVDIHPCVAKLTDLGLAGEFQRKNATLACYLAAERLKIPISHDTPLPSEFIAGLKQASWPGRCQVLDTQKARWFIDGAHTVESLEVAAEWVAKSADKSKPISLVFNQQKRDNVDELLTGLFQKLKSLGLNISTAYFTTNKTHDWGFEDDMVSHNVSSESVERLTIQKQLAGVWKKVDPSCNVVVCSSLEQVEKQAEGQVFATGSLLMIGGLLVLLQ